jgi:hypothetical protein
MLVATLCVLTISCGPTSLSFAACCWYHRGDVANSLLSVGYLRLLFMVVKGYQLEKNSTNQSKATFMSLRYVAVVLLVREILKEKLRVHVGGDSQIWI